MRSPILLSSTVALFMIGCDLNPQPLPPGEQPDGGNTETAPGAGSTNSGGAAVDASVAGSKGDAEAPDGALQDGSTDAPSDAPLDAGDPID